MTLARRGLAVAIALGFFASSSGASDTDLRWIETSISAQSAPTSPTVVEKRRQRSVTDYAGLARFDIEKPMRRADPCIPAPLQGVLNEVEAKFGGLRITSTCRSASANRAAGGAPQSLHLSGQAVDFRADGSPSAVNAFLEAHGDVGGLKHYGGGLFHIDTGARRPM